MSTKTSIAWTDISWNPIRGCSLVSAGCANCYAMKQAHRFSGDNKPYGGLTEIGPHGPRWSGKIRLVPEALDEPLHWKTPRRVFVNSMSDLFHEDVPNEFLEDVWARMCMADHHTYQILTKRPQRMFDWLTMQDWERVGMIVAKTAPMAAHRALARKRAGFKMFEHVCIGVSVEDQVSADERIPILLQTPAAVRWISAEPLLGPIDLTRLPIPERALLPEYGTSHGFHFNALHRDEDTYMHNTKHHLDWVVIGGESGPGARPCDLSWIRAIKDQCQAAGVPVFVKQLGANVLTNYYDDWREEGYEANGLTWPDPIGWNINRDGQPPLSAQVRLKLKNKKGGNMAEFPVDLRVREWPR